jgi:hypothetical protein
VEKFADKMLNSTESFGFTKAQAPEDEQNWATVAMLFEDATVESNALAYSDLEHIPKLISKHRKNPGVCSQKPEQTS